MSAIASVMILIAATSLAAQSADGSSAGRSTASESAAAGRAKIILSPLESPAGDAVARDIASSVYQSLILMLHLSGKYTIDSATSVHPFTSYHRSVRYYESAGARIGIFGRVRPGPSGSYTITVEYWRASAPQAKPKRLTRTITDIFAVFTAADQLAVRLASAAAGHRLSVGTVVVKNASILPKFSIYADGQLVARNRSRVSVLAGKRTITVEVPGPAGDQPFQTFHADIKPGGTVALALRRKAASLSKAGTSPRTAANRPAASRPLPGELRVASSPVGATVFLDGKRMGRTPLVLRSIGAGTHTLNLTRRYFTRVHRLVRIRAGATSTLRVKLSVDKRDPAIAARIIHPLGTTGGSLLWTAAQVGSFAGIAVVGSKITTTGAPLSTSSFWTARPFPGNIDASQMLEVDSVLFFPRIGDSLAGSSLLTDIGDIAAAAGDALITIGFYPEWTASSSAATTTAPVLGNGTVPLVGLALIGGDILYDAISAPFGAAHANKQLLQYVSTHGSLPPQPRPRRPHRLIVETGGDSFVRVGYHLPLLPDYLSLEATGGIGATSLSPFSPAVSGDVDLSVNPWGAKTGNLRPELFFGLRANTNFSSASVSPELGAGSDFIGRRFDIFTRGGIDYNLITKRWDQFFTIGTRIF